MILKGDPLYPSGLEYLFGVYYRKAEQPVYKAFWAHNAKEEQQAFKHLMEFFKQHLAQYPQAHIYHYNHYEPTALKRLAGRYAIAEEHLDWLLRNGKFVDLYLVVREAMRISASSYSLKSLEPFFTKDQRQGTVINALGSILAYNRWRETKDQQLLDEIASYNKVDCISTKLLYDWLVKIKPARLEFPKEDQPLSELAPPEKLAQKPWEEEYAIYRQKLAKLADEPISQRLLDLLEFHKREAKPHWWRIYERQNKQLDDLFDDHECITGLLLAPIKPERVKNSLIYSYNFPPARA